MGRGEDSAAAAELEAANKLSPGNAEILERLGDTYGYQGQHEKALLAYQEASEISPDQGSLWAKLGFSLASLNRTEEAVAALEESLRCDPENGDAYFLLGDMYSELDRIDEGIEAYKKSLTLKPDKKEVHYNLGTLYAGRKQYAEAFGSLRSATKLDPEYAAAWANMAIVAERLELDQDALRAHERVVALGKARGFNYFRLGILYAKADEPESSIANFRSAIEMEPDRFRQILLNELKNVTSVLDSVRYKKEFAELLTGPPPKP
jgi:tetratricopeptide (TPR) repeat protein